MAQIVKRGNAGEQDFTAEAQRSRRGSRRGKREREEFPSSFVFSVVRSLHLKNLCATSANLCASAVNCFCLIALLFGCINGQAPLIRYEDSRISMACTYSIVVYGDDAQKLKQAVAAALDEVDRIDRLMSNYKPDSPLSQLNREAAKRPVKVEKELFTFLMECRAFSYQSEGAFDITVGPLMKAWGFFRGEGRMPTPLELAEVRKVVGYRHLIFDVNAQTIQFDRDGIELDLGGIAKGYAVERVRGILLANDIRRALISAGGSTIYALGSPPESDAWELQIQDPVDAQKIAVAVHLKNETLSVAGSSEKFFELNGKRYSHIMDPRTGKPVMNILSVAVITEWNGQGADALDNVFYVLGVKKSRELMRRIDGIREAYFFLPNKTRRWRLIHLK
jgi:thiamine biosynthesis lipoprotein